MSTTVFRNAAWVVAWDEARAAHVYRRDIDVAIRGNEIAFLGKNFTGHADAEVDCTRRLLLPGLVNIHTHPTSEPLRKGITDETRSPGFWHSSLYEFLTVFNNDRDGSVAAMQVALAELLMSGVTTVVDLSIAFDGWIDTLAQSGIRAVAAPMFRDARWFTKNGHQLDYAWDKKAGREGFDNARRLIDLANQHPSGRLSGMMCPAQIDTCSPELIRDAYDYAVERRLPLQIHASQSVNEFHEMFRRYGKTPIGWLHGIGALGRQTIIGHGIFLDHHPWLHWPTRGDLGPPARYRRDRRPLSHGLHAPRHRHEHVRSVRARGRQSRAWHRHLSAQFPGRDAQRLHPLARGRGYRRRRHHARHLQRCDAGGARALLRDDIGRLKVGAKADLVLVDVKHPSMMPMREPIRSLLYVAADRAVRDVYVDGLRVVAEGRAVNVDYQAASEALEEAQKRSMREVPRLDWAGRTADQLAPMVLPISSA